MGGTETPKILQHSTITIYHHYICFRSKLVYLVRLGFLYYKRQEHDETISLEFEGRVPGFPRAGRTHTKCVAVVECRVVLIDLGMEENPRLEGKYEGVVWLG